MKQMATRIEGMDYTDNGVRYFHNHNGLRVNYPAGTRFGDGFVQPSIAGVTSEQPPSVAGGATARPWRITQQRGIDPRGYGCIVGDTYSDDEEGDRTRTGTDRIAVVALATDHEQANARLIVTAVNNLQPMMEALQAALVLCNALGPKETVIAYNGRDDFDVQALIRDTLNRVRQER